MAGRLWFSLVAFIFSTAITRCASSPKYVYITQNITAFPCMDIPNDGVCPTSYRIPTYDGRVQDNGKTGKLVYTSSDMTRILNIVMKNLDGRKASETCKNTSRAYFCSRFLPVCDDNDDFVYVNGNKTVNLCEKSRHDCSNLSLSAKDDFFNCTELRERTERHRRRQECIPFPVVDDVPCPKRLHKVPSQLNFKKIIETLLLEQNMLKSIPDLNAKCRSDTAKVICDAVAPVCTSNMRYIGYLLSKQECWKIMECLNESKNVQLVEGVFGLCNRLPDATKGEKIDQASVCSIICPTKEAPSKPNSRNGDQSTYKATFKRVTNTIALLTLIYGIMI